MNESSEIETDQQEPSPAQEGPGKVLSRSRERQGLSIQEVSQELHLKEDIIQSLERDQYAELAGRTYIRGYLTNYARLLGESETRILALFDESYRQDSISLGISRLGAASAKHESFGSLFWLTPMVFILIGIGLWAWYNEESSSPSLSPIPIQEFDPTANKSVDEEKIVAPYTDPVEINPIALEQGTVGEKTIEKSNAISVLIAGNEPASSNLTEGIPATILDGNLEIGSQVESSATGTPQTEADPLDSSRDELNQAPTNAMTEAGSIGVNDENETKASKVEFILEFSKDCWAEARDADGVRHLYNLYQAGSRKTLQVKLPLQLTLGDASGVTIFRDGQPFALPTDKKIYDLTIE